MRRPAILRRLLRVEIFILILVGVSFALWTVLGFRFMSGKEADEEQKELSKLKSLPTKGNFNPTMKAIEPAPGLVNANPPAEKDKKTEEIAFPKPNYNLHAFYYPWYGNPETDNHFYHWNHPLIPHWNPKERNRWPVGQHLPPEDIGSNYYPVLGAYSSKDPVVIEDHMKQVRSAGIGVLAVSWYPPAQADDNGKPWNDVIPLLMDAAHKFKLKICFHLEPYKDRSASTIRRDIATIMSAHGSHPAFYKRTWQGKELPLYYIYDSYLVKKDEWASIFRPDGTHSLRDTSLDGLFIGLLVDDKHKVELVGAGFDGFYTYFASDGFTYGSSSRNWGNLAKYAALHNILFIPSAGPGYIDVRVRPWNAKNTKDRENGGYYELSMKSAVSARPPIISITSFNEWHEGTQIEKAIPHAMFGFTYMNYKPHEPDYYLAITRKWSFKYAKIVRT